MKEKILLVDDEPHVLQGYKRRLRKQFKLDTAPGGKEALEKIEQDGPYAIVVSDMRMPGMTGLELLTTLKEKSPEIIRIMLTGNADQETVIDAVNKGEVFKFLTKPCSAETMETTLDAGLAQYHQIQEKRAILEQSTSNVQILSEKLSYQSQHDYLTGLANRQAFELRIQHFLETAQNDGIEHVLCYLDLDHFHTINDTCGNFAGDEFLRQISNLLSSQQRGTDVLARLAADEFGMLLHDCGIEEAENFTLGVQALLRQFTFEWEDELFSLTASAGLVPINNDSSSVAMLLSSAETACNVIKDSGGDNLRVGDPNDKALTRRLNESQWVSKIHLALRDNRFCLFFQPIIPIYNTNQEGDHFEILVRMVDEQGEFISPGIFLQAAENYYLSPQIDRWVIKNVEVWLRHHPDHLERLAKCSINLSAHSLGNEDILTFICETFDDSPVPASKICFEVTETAAISNLNRVIEFIKTLKSRGFYFSLDDFGSGFSSFAYLKNLPVDYLKIDGQFVKNIHNDVVDRAMVKSINEIGKVMGKQTIAEFVENQEIMDILETLNVDFAQGHLFAMARPLDEKEL